MVNKAQTFTEFLNDPERSDFNSYLEHCKEMGYKVYQVEGIVIYGFGHMDEGIPADIYFLPGKLKEGQPFEAFVKESLLDKQNTIYDMVFGHLRMRNRKLASVIESMKHDTVSFSPLFKYQSAKISYCKITFNLFYGDTSSRFQPDPKVSDLIINFKDQPFTIRCKYLPSEYGLPVYFESLEF